MNKKSLNLITQTTVFVLALGLGLASASAQLATKSYNNQPVQGSMDIPSLDPNQASMPGQPQLSVEDYKRIMAELQAAKSMMEERNKMLDEIMKNQ